MTSPSRSERVAVLALLLLPLLITFGSILSKHTISFASLRGGDPTRGINILPVLDPSAGSHQDEPWTYFIGSSWATGEIPLINQANGLGAPLLASLQSGALYPGNILLALLPKASAQFFDVFSVAHVALLAWGLYALGRRFTDKRWLAALVAGSFAASLACVYHINMVHFRAFAWSPWIAVSLIGLVSSPGRNIGAAILFAVASWCCFSAGNPQEAVLDFGAATIVAAVIVLRDHLWRRAWILPTAAGLGLLIGLATMLPYLAGITSGDLWSVADPNRSRLSIRPTMLLDMVIPRGTGYAGGMWHFGSGFFELQFAWPVIWLVGLVSFGMFFRRPQTALWAIPLMIVFLLSLAKLLGLGPWEWLSQVPIVSGIRFTKYTLWIVLIAIPLVILGLDALQQRCRQTPHTAYVTALAMLVLFALAFIGYLADSNWRPSFDSGSTRLAAAMALASLGGSLTLPWILCQQRRIPLLVLWAVAMAFALRPAGFHLELPYHQMRNHQPPSQLQAADLSDNNWDRGVSRGAPAFFVSDPNALKMLNLGDTLTLPSGTQRTIQRTTGDQVWLEGPQLLDPQEDGFPHYIAVATTVAERQHDLEVALTSPWPRVVDASYTPNTNLILGHSSPWVFDPVMNRRYRDLVTREFQTFNPGFDTHPASAYPLTKHHADVLRMLGVGTVLGHPMDPTAYYRSVSPTTHLIDHGLLPEALVIPESAVASLTALFQQGHYGDFVDEAQKNGTICPIARTGPNSLTVEVPVGSGNRRVLVNRVFMTGWSTMAGAQPLADFWLSAPVKPSGGGVAFRFWPPGLSLGLLLAGIGTLGLAILVWWDRRCRPAEVPCPG